MRCCVWLENSRQRWRPAQKLISLRKRRILKRKKARSWSWLLVNAQKACQAVRKKEAPHAFKSPATAPAVTLSSGKDDFSCRSFFRCHFFVRWPGENLDRA